MKAYKCDMCGKIILGKDITYNLVVWKQQGEMTAEITATIDLCPVCMERANNVLGQHRSKTEFMDEN